jgi:hypothetical protein
MLFHEIPDSTLFVGIRRYILALIESVITVEAPLPLFLFHLCRQKLV